MNPEATEGDRRGHELLSRIFAASLGAFLGLSLLKFGNPPIMERWVTAPSGFYEFVLGYPWPISWAYWAIAIIAGLGALLARSNRNAPRWIVVLPLAWWVWQLIAGTRTVDAQLTIATLKHFTACVVCFYLGFFSLSRVRQLGGFWLGLIGGFALVLAAGWQQRFGGLEETRRYFFTDIYPQLKEVPPEYLKRISSNRIFATLFYPNALAGALLLLLPPTISILSCASMRLTPAARGFAVALFAVAGLACLYWSGSKGGWLVMLFLILLALLRLPLPRKLKIGIVAALIIFGLVGFAWKYRGFFEKGATSVIARFDYWRAAIETAIQQPLFGTGPGTFAIPYSKIKAPESEMARLVHNDFLEQASDSGIIGFILYSGFIVSVLTYAFRNSASGPEWLAFAVWLGLLGWNLQGVFEFGLYIPALAWVAFAFMGWLLGTKDESP